MNNQWVHRLEKVISSLEQMASGNMSLRISVGDQRDHIDALAFGINILADEIDYKQAQEEKRRRDLEEAHLQLSKTLNELKMTQEQLIQAAKLAILGEVCAELAHEVSNPLATISGYMDVMSSVMEKNKSFKASDLNPYIDKTHKQIARAVEIISHIRDFSRKCSQDFEVIDLTAVVDASLLLFDHQFRKQKITIEKDFSVLDLEVNGNFILLEQVLINILANAKDALLKASETSARKIKIRLSRRGPMAQIEVFDNGVGLDLNIPDVKYKVFEPFFTTKIPGQGTGIGLSISQGIVDSHRGNIRIDRINANGYKTVVVVELPLSATIF